MDLCGNLRMGRMSRSFKNHKGRLCKYSAQESPGLDTQRGGFVLRNQERRVDSQASMSVADLALSSPGMVHATNVRKVVFFNFLF